MLKKNDGVLGGKKKTEREQKKVKKKDFQEIVLT
jgi:hypothetical protein